LRLSAFAVLRLITISNFVGFRGKVPSANRRKADARAADLAPTVKELQAAGVTSLRAIADGLNAKNVPTARGQGNWSAVQVMRVLERLGADV
jgi:hypothetical protein